MGDGELEELRTQVRHLTARVYALEERLGARPPPAVPLDRFAPASPPASGAPQAAAARPAPRPAVPAAPDLETTLGVRGLTALGTLVLVLGGAWFVLFFLGEALQILTGVAGGLALLALGEALHRRARYGPYPYFLVAGGVVLVYFSVFAAYAFEDYRAATGIPLLADAALLGLVAAGGVALALRYESRALAAEGFLLGFLTTFLVLGADPALAREVETLALAYVAILAGGLLAVVALRRWTDVGVGGAIATWGVLALLRPELTVSPWLFGAIVALIAAELWALALRAHAVDAAQGTAAAAVASLGASFLLWWNVDLAAPAFADETLGILALVHLAAAALVPTPALRGVAGIAATALAFAWAPAALDDAAVTILWAVFAVPLAVAAFRIPTAEWPRYASFAASGLLVVRVLFHDTVVFLEEAPAAPLHVASVLAASAALAASYALLSPRKAEAATPATAMLWAAAVLPLPWLTFLLERYASVAWAAEGAFLVAIGFATDRRDARLAGIAVLLLVVGRVLLVDARSLALEWRIVVYLSVGALVLGAAFLFARRR